MVLLLHRLPLVEGIPGMALGRIVAHSNPPLPPVSHSNARSFLNTACLLQAVLAAQWPQAPALCSWWQG